MGGAGMGGRAPTAIKKRARVRTSLFEPPPDLLYLPGVNDSVIVDG